MPFVKGKSGNPGGRPKEVAEVRALAQQHSRKAIEVLASLLDSDDEKSKIAAANSILDRAVGKPPQAIVGDDESDPVSVRVTEERARGVARSLLDIALGGRTDSPERADGMADEGAEKPKTAP